MDALYVVGAGGIGCAVGYALCAAGCRVTFVDADPDKVRWGRVHGLRIDLRPALRARFQAFEEWSPDPTATVLLCTKCYDNAAILARLPPSAGLIPVQNGFDAALVERGGGLEGVASFVSECYPHRPHTRITRRGSLHLGWRGLRSGNAGNGDDDLLAGLAELLCGALARLGIRLEVVPDILPYKYSKLMYNAAISPVAAAAGLDNGQLLAVPKARRLFFALLRENYAILRGAAIRLGKIGPFHPDTVERILRRQAVARALAWAFYPTLRRTYCSMSGDLPAGRTEIDFYNGHLIHLAGDRPCPFNRRVYQFIKSMERNRVAPGPQMLEALTV